MCRALDVEGWDDPRLASFDERKKHRDLANDLMDMCYAVTPNITMADAAKRFDAERIPFAMVLSPEELVDDPHAIAIGMFEESDHPVAGRTRLPRHPAQFAETPARLRSMAPSLGEHTETILSELGLTADLADLRSRGIIA